MYFSILKNKNGIVEKIIKKVICELRYKNFWMIKCPIICNEVNLNINIQRWEF